MGKGAGPRMCCAPNLSIVNSTDRVVDCCFYRFVSILSGSFQEFLPFHADYVKGDSLVALVTADFVLYRTVTPWGFVRVTQRPFYATEEGSSEPPSGGNELWLCLTVGFHAGGIKFCRSKEATE
ncbi:hypothetical protein TcCL_Unassigned04794 [Trypanosoma cruzi]|nr:hypothetical protein TcCL_Unassigned04794 [Trypanosoma cruzi]